MKKLSFGSICGFLMVGLSLVLNIDQFINYLTYGERELVYTYHYLLFYISWPAFIATLLLFIYYLTAKQRNYLQRSFMIFWVCHIVIVMSVWTFFRTQYNKLEIVIKNFSGKDYWNINIDARNMQHYREAHLRPGDSFFYSCKCREVTSTDTFGIKVIMYDKKGNQRMLRPLKSNGPFALNRLVVQIINDTFSVANHDNTGDTWFWIEKPSLLFRKSELDKLKDL